jgi:hypothetical protein
MPAPGTPFLPELSPRAVSGLAAAIDWLLDHWPQDVERLRSGEERIELDELQICEHLPPIVKAHLTPLVAKKLVVCLTVVSWKLCQVSRPYPACVAEELCLHAVIVQAKTQIDFWEDSDPDRLPAPDPRYQDELNDLYDAAFEDTDFLEMFDPAMDGVETSDVGREMGMTSLSPADLFKPFRGGSHAVHPYLADDAEHWPRFSDDPIEPPADDHDTPAA